MVEVFLALGPGILALVLTLAPRPYSLVRDKSILVPFAPVRD